MRSGLRKRRRGFPGPPLPRASGALHFGRAVTGVVGPPASHCPSRTSLRRYRSGLRKSDLEDVAYSSGLFWKGAAMRCAQAWTLSWRSGLRKSGRKGECTGHGGSDRRAMGIGNQRASGEAREGPRLKSAPQTSKKSVTEPADGSSFGPRSAKDLERAGG